MKDEKQVDSSYRRIITEKLFNFIETQVTPVEKEIFTRRIVSYAASS